MDKDIEYVKELLENQLDSLSEKIDTNNKNINEKIDSNNQHVMEILHYIREQTTRTNGRVSKAEDEIRRLSEIDTKNLINYPGKEEIKKINEKLAIIDEQNLIVKVWNKYPKALFTGVVVAVLITMGTLAYTLISVHSMIQKVKSENQTVKYLDNNVYNNEDSYWKMEYFNSFN